MPKSEWIYFVVYQYTKEEEKHPMVLGTSKTWGTGNYMVTLMHPISCIEHIKDIQRIIGKEKGFDSVVITSLTLL